MSGEQQTDPRFGGLWEGIVVDVNPPSNVPANSVRVRVIGIHDDDVAVEDLPWAMVIAHPMGNVAGPVSCPALLQPCWIMFRHSYLAHPVVVGGIFTSRDTLSGTKEEDIAGDSRRITRGTAYQISQSEKTHTSNSTKIVTGAERLAVDTQHTTVADNRLTELGSDTCIISSGRTLSIGGTSETDIGGDQIEAVLGSRDVTVGQDDSHQIMGQAIRRAFNITGLPMIDDAILDEAVNGVFRMVAKVAPAVEGSSLMLDPIGARTELSSFIRLVIKATANVVISGAVVQLGGESAVIPIALLPHVHISPFMGLLTGPATGIPGISFTKKTFAE